MLKCNHFCRLAWVVLLIIVGCSKQDSNTSEVGPSSSDAAGTDDPGECRRDGELSSRLIRIAVIPKGTTHVYWKSILAGARKAEKELEGLTIIWKGPVKEDDRADQISVVENFITSGVDGMVIAPLDDVALTAPLRAAVSAGIGVVIMDSALKARPCVDFASFVATDNHAGGQRAARQLGQAMGGRGKALLMRYAVGSASNEQREEGFLAALRAEFPGVQIVSSDQYAGVTSEQAQNKADNLLQRFPDLDGVFCPNEPTTFGMLRALEEAGRAGKVKLVGFDTSPKLVTAMAEGKVHGLVLQDPVNMGYLAVKIMYSYLRGQKVQTRIDTGIHVATTENLNDPKIQALLSPALE